MTDTNEKNRDTTQKKQNTDTATQEEHTAEPRIGEVPRRNHKDSTFCLLFSEPARAIELYNASHRRESAAGYRADLYDPRKCPLCRPQQ